jgi:dienelactone hydrolase
MKNLFSIIGISCLAASVATAQPTEKLWDMSALTSPPEVFDSPEIQSSDPRIRALFFEGAPYRGKETRIFAWLGTPETKPGEKVPGIVLLHGGGGTAFESWVKLWVDRGYTAIAIDHFGTLPVPEKENPRPRNPDGGPPGGSKTFSQLGEPLRDQWPYQAITAAILAHSLLLAQPEVDAQRTGVTGISWGGYLTCLLAGLDDRLKFAVPVYGCGHYEETTFAGPLQKLPADQSALWYAQWDAKNYIPAIGIPTLWINGPNDKFFWPPAWQKSHRQMPAALRAVSLRLGMKHGSPPAGDPPEVAAFADRVVRGGPGFAKATTTWREGDELVVDFESPRPLSKADLVYTADTESPWEERVWESTPAEIAGASVRAVLPPAARLYYVALEDEGGLISTTDYEEKP